MKTNLQRRQQGSGNNGAGAFFGKQSGGDAFFSKNSPERREIDRGSQGVHRAQRMVAPPPPSTPAIQRTISEEQLPRTPVSRIMSDGSYFENNITRIEYFTAELAILHYNDGTQLRLGLVPEYIQAPIEGVDYVTPSSQHIQISEETPGRLRFIPQGASLNPPSGMTFGQVVDQFSDTITFHIDPGSQKIVPTIVNSITAPRLSQALRQARDEYVRRTDAMAQGMVETLEVMQWIIILASLLPTGGESAVAGGGGRVAAEGAAASGIASRVIPRLSQFFLRLLRSGSAEAIEVEGVAFGGVRAAMQGGRLVITRGTIVNASRIAGQGRMVHALYEQAAMAAAREAGAAQVVIRMETVVNQTWATYLQSVGYSFEVVETATGFSRVLQRIIAL